MRMRFGIGTIIMVVYLAFMITMYVILPMLKISLGPFGGYFPLFFFFPFMFGRRGARSRNRSQTSRQAPPDHSSEIDQMANSTFDSSEWEKNSRMNYDEYGIRTVSGISRYWYYVGVLGIAAVTIIILFFKGFITL